MCLRETEKVNYICNEYICEDCTDISKNVITVKEVQKILNYNNEKNNK